MPYDKTKPYSCPCCGYWNGDMKYDYYKPLIKDEKIRKAVRAWAEMNDLGIVQYCHDDMFDLSWFISGEIKIYFKESGESCLNREFYTIDELCGEDEE